MSVAMVTTQVEATVW